MSQPIQLHFYRARNGLPNFGDELSPEVVAFVTGRRVARADRWTCDLTAIGSILTRYVQAKGKEILAERAASGNPMRVWGSGLIKEGGPYAHAMVPLAVRGALTRAALGAPEATPLGDPGLLTKAMLNRPARRQGIGLVPHYTDKSHPMVQALCALPGVRMIDVERGGLVVSAEISECAMILSSSLHGLVVADAFGLPNWRLKFSDDVTGGDFKFRDYASALGRTQFTSHDLAAPQDALTLVQSDTDFTYQDNVDAVCSGLEHALKSAF